MYFARNGNSKSYRQIFTRDENLIKHLKKGRCAGEKTKSICSGGKFGYILNSPEKVFHDGYTKFSCSASQWTEADALKVGKAHS